MTRRDFELIAAVLRSERELPHNGLLELVAIDGVSRAMAKALASEHPRFNTARFLAAAGVPPYRSTGPLDAPDEVEL